MIYEIYHVIHYGLTGLFGRRTHHFFYSGGFLGTVNGLSWVLLHGNLLGAEKKSGDRFTIELRRIVNAHKILYLLKIVKIFNTGCVHFPSKYCIFSNFGTIGSIFIFLPTKFYQPHQLHKSFLGEFIIIIAGFPQKIIVW